MSTDNIVTLFFLIVAALIFLNLRSVLGKRTGHEKPPYDPFSPRPGEPARPPMDDGKIITLPKRGPTPGENRYEVIDSFAEPGTPMNGSLRTVFDADPTFNPKEFVDGAKMAYEMIVLAFAEGDRKTLQSLLSAEVFDGFNRAITEREKAGEKQQSTFVGIEKADIVSAGLEGSEVSITMRIVSQLISATYDKAGTLVDGNAEDVAEVKDTWTFARDIRSRDPNWKLVATQAEA
ncbi:MAG: hypothetical protein RLZZ444_3957 [Pseudomonadota bacterium]|jgi:predicted lipid-binding transport protein (Tim44 family)